MRPSRTLGVFVFAAALTGSAMGADLAVTAPAPTFDWNGFYAGLGVTGSTWWNGGPSVMQGSIDGIVGVNVTSDQFLFGVEGQLSGYVDDTSTRGWIAKGEVRAGYLATENALIYAALEALHFDAGANYAGVGAGLEFAATDNMSVDIEGTYYPWTDNGAWRSAQVSGSLLWHFR